MDSDPLPEPIFLYRSDETEIGIKVGEGVKRPSDSFWVHIEKAKMMREAPLARISTNRLNLGWFLDREPEYLAHLKVLCDEKYFLSHVTNMYSVFLRRCEEVNATFETSTPTGTTCQILGMTCDL
eukprot:PhF_6_TR39767/c0_g1_i1/m.59169